MKGLLVLLARFKDRRARRVEVAWDYNSNDLDQ